MADYALHMADNEVQEGAKIFPALASRLEQLAGTLSGGEQQMLAMARALMMRPRLLMLDEISMGLAPLIVNQLFEAVRKLAERGVTILLVEQYVEAALELADYAYVLDKGRVVDVGEPGDLREAGLASTYMGGAG
jgi:branched-chain amino acid transport system ATP-binding protein